MSVSEADQAPALVPVARGELVPIGGRALARVGERFYAGELRITLALIVLAAGVAAVIGVLGAIGTGSWRSVLLAGVVAALAAAAMSRAEEVYVAMRARPALGFVPAVIIGTLLAIDGALDSPLYIPAQAVPVTAALTGSIALAVGASGVMGALYVVGLVASGGTLSGEDRFLATASVFGFVAWAGLFGYFAHALTAFVMRLPVITSVEGGGARPPRRIRVFVHRADPEPEEPASELPFRLTARQLQVAALVAEGLTSGQIARELGISEGTVDRHVTSAMRRAGVASRSQLAALVIASGLVVRDPE